MILSCKVLLSWQSLALKHGLLRQQWKQLVSKVELRDQQQKISALSQLVNSSFIAPSQTG